MPPPLDPLLFITLLVLLGAAAGGIAGLFGIGGGIVIVPALAMLFKTCGLLPDAAMHAAIGASMMTIVPTSIASIRAHARHDAIDRATVKHWTPTVIGGAIIGGLIALYLSGAALSLIFGVFVGLLALFMGFAPTLRPSPNTSPRGWKQRGLAFVIGFVSALVGIGGGSLTVPTLVISRMPIHKAIGTSSVIGLLISLPAALVYLATHITHEAVLPLASFGILAPLTMVTAPYGAKLAHRLPAQKLKRVFALLLVVIAVKMLRTGLN